MIAAAAMPVSALAYPRPRVSGWVQTALISQNPVRVQPFAGLRH
jgi:hypothetical protein